MLEKCKAGLILTAGLLLAGCKSTTITNLTPTQLVRNSSGLYPFEMAWDTRQQSLRPESLKPYVIVGMETYPMRPTAVVSNRWETLIPISPDQKLIYYRYKVDYDYNSIPQARSNSKLSPPYRLEVTEK